MPLIPPTGLINKWVYIAMTLIFFVIFMIVFKWQHACYWFNEDYIVNHELLGTFGDFIGGVLGTLLAMVSIILLIRTFNQQRYATNDSIKLTENQRFNNLFFELLRLYQDEIRRLRVDNNNCTNDILATSGKDFFDYYMQKLQNDFAQQTTFDQSQDEALKVYMDFYIQYRTKLSIYYRTLYRIYDLLDNATTIEETSKKNYLKIIRAQLTESELFFLRYNAMGFYGAKFTTYINRYNVLKHLPILDLLEFRNWSKTLSATEKIGINIIFNYIESIVCDKIKRNQSGDGIIELPDSCKYKIRAVIDQNCSRMTILCFIHENATNDAIEYEGFNKLSYSQIRDLLDCFLKEIFVYKTFKEINTIEDLSFFSTIIDRKDNVKCIVSSVTTQNQSRIRIRPEDYPKDN